MSGIKKKQVKQKKKPKPPTKHIESSFAYSDNESDFGNCQNDELSQAVDKLSHKFSGETKKIAKLLQSFDYFSQEISNLVKRIEGLVKSNHQLKAELKSVKENELKLEGRIQQLEEFALHHKQSYNNNNMIITNLPKFSEDTNLKQVVLKFAEQVNCSIKDGDIIDVYQSENKKYKSYPMIVKMKSQELKSRCMEFRKQHKTIDIKIISPNLDIGTKNINFHHLMDKETSELMQKTKEAAKKSKFKFVWFNGITILARKETDSKIINIKSTNDLGKIK